MKPKLYRHYDKKGTLLYVGVSLSFFRRLANHKSYSRWFDQVTTITLETFETKEEMLQKEKEVIKKEKPKFNVMYLNTVSKTLTVSQMSEYLGIKTRTLYRMIDENRFLIDPLPGITPRLWRIADIDKWLAGDKG